MRTISNSIGQHDSWDHGQFYAGMSQFRKPDDKIDWVVSLNTEFPEAQFESIKCLIIYNLIHLSEQKHREAEYKALTRDPNDKVRPLSRSDLHLFANSLRFNGSPRQKSSWRLTSDSSFEWFTATSSLESG